MSRRPYQGPSDSQANAEALARRDAGYAVPHEVSLARSWDFRRREPTDLREAVRMVRRAYADEVPARLHEGPDSIGPDGTPKMTARAEGYIFGSPQGSDRSDPDQLVSFYHSPFRARLSQLERGDETERKHAALVAHVTIGGQGPREAAIAEGVPPWCARIVAEDAIRAFLRSISDLKLHLPRQIEEVGAVA